MVGIASSSETRIKLVGQLIDLFKPWPRNEIARQASCSTSTVQEIAAGKAPLTERSASKIRGAYVRFLDHEKVDGPARDEKLAAFDQLVSDIFDQQRNDPAMQRQSYTFRLI